MAVFRVLPSHHWFVWSAFNSSPSSHLCFFSSSKISSVLGKLKTSIMGNKGTKEGGKKGKGGKDEEPKEVDSKSSPAPASSSSPAPADTKGEENDIHPSWNEPVLFSADNNNKVTKDDFELLAVIGKGSFGKVCECLSGFSPPTQRFVEFLLSSCSVGFLCSVCHVLVYP